MTEKTRGHEEEKKKRLKSNAKEGDATTNAHAPATRGRANLSLGGTILATGFELDSSVIAAGRLCGYRIATRCDDRVMPRF